MPVHPGLNRVFVRLPGAGDAITVRANTAALAVCLASGRWGSWRGRRFRQNRGAAWENRTPDLFITSESLYRLS